MNLRIHPLFQMIMLETFVADGSFGARVTNVFRREGEVMRHFWGSELL